VSGGGQPRMVWSLTNHQESRWMQAQVPITPDYPFLLTFEGKIKNMYNRSISLKVLL
jgi:hypothetical protein